MTVFDYILIFLIGIPLLIGIIYILSRIQMYAWLCELNRQLMDHYKSKKENDDERQEKE